MTDISDWPGLVHLARLRARNHDGTWLDFGGAPRFSEYVLVPLNDYQLSALRRVLLEQAHPDGDWHGELLAITNVAADKAGWKVKP